MRLFFCIFCVIFVIINATPTPFPSNSIPYPLQPPSDPIVPTLSMKQQSEMEEKRTLLKPNFVTLPVF